MAIANGENDMDKNEILKILEMAKDENGEVPMRLVRQAFEKLPKPYDDTISRQDAIDAIDVLCQEHMYKIPGKVETYSQYNEAWQDALDRAEGAIGNLPSAQPEPIWGLPVSADRPLADVEIIPRLRQIQAGIPGGSYAIDRAIEIIEAVAERRTDGQDD